MNKSTEFNVCLKVLVWRQKMVCPEDGAAANTGSLIFCNCVTPFYQEPCTISHTSIHPSSSAYPGSGRGGDPILTSAESAVTALSYLEYPETVSTSQISQELRYFTG